MRAQKLVVAALLALLGASSVRAEDPVLAGQRLAELHLKLKTGLDSLGKAVSDLRAVPPPKDLPERLGKLLKDLPPELSDYRDTRALVKAPDDGGLADKVAAGLQRADELSKAYWAGAEPAKTFPDDVKALQTQLAALLGDTERRVPALSAQTRLDGRLPPAAENAASRAVAPSGLRAGSVLAACVNSFDGKGCGGAAAGGGPSRSDESPAGGQRAEGATGPGEIPSAHAAAVRSSPGARARGALPVAVPGVPRASLASGGRARLDAAAVPAPGAHVSAAAPPPGSVAAPKTAASASAPAAAKAEPLSPASQACVAAVSGPDPSDPHHTSLAEMCKTSPNLAPVLAGLLDSVKEQFGTATGIVTNLIFLLLGLLMSVATGGVAAILKLLALIGAGWAIWKLVSGLVSAYRASRDAAAGSPEKAAALKQIGMLGGSLLIMITMALVGWGVGKTKPGAAAVKSMEGGLTAAMDKMGLTGAMEGLNSRLPAPLVAMLEKVVGKAPEKVKAAEEELPPKALVAEEPAALKASLAQKVTSMWGARARGVTARVAAKVTDNVRSEVAGELKGILSATLSKSKGRITGAQFNELLESLTAYAKSNGVEIKPGDHWFWELVRKGRTMGVYPQSATRLETVGFGGAEANSEIASTSLHELAHMFHTIQMRVSLIRGGVGPEDSAAFLKLMENGGNYRELEFAATKIGSMLHDAMPSSTLAPTYVGKVNALIDATDGAMTTGRVHVKFNLSAEDVYAWALSRGTLVLGQSVKGLVLVKMPFIYFMSLYAANVDISNIPEVRSIDAATLKALGLTPGRVGFRDLIDAGISRSMAGTGSNAPRPQ